MITPTTSYERLGDVDLVVEAVPERIELKREVFAELDRATPGHAILASNTSSLSVTEMGLATTRPELVVGLHFFFPASVNRLVEVIEGDDTSPETVQAATDFAQSIRKTPIRCADVPGFVVNRILTAAVSEVWRHQEQTGADTSELDRLVAESSAAPLGPFALADVLGLDTVLYVTEYLQQCYGERFHVHQRMRDLVAAGDLGVKTGKGFYEQPALKALLERFRLKTLVEACLVLEEGVASMREIDLGMMAAAGFAPPPLAAADQVGLDVVLEQLEQASYTAPVVLRRLVAQGRLGVKSGQGFYPYPRPDGEWAEGPVKLESREQIAIAWLDRPPANSINSNFAAALERIWEFVSSSGSVRALVFASANPQLFSAGADIKQFTRMDARDGRALIERMHGLLLALREARVVTIAAVNAGAFGGGCELAMACDIRLAAESASFGQPEIGLGIMPGFGGTQRLPRLIGEPRALEMNLTGEAISAYEAYELGLVNRVAPDHELFDAAMLWARKLASQAPLALEQIKRVSADADLVSGLEAEKEAFLSVFGSEDAREGFAAFVEKRTARFQGR